MTATQPLQAVPVIPALPDDSAPSTSSVPSRKMFASAIGTVVSWGAVAIATHYGVIIPDYVQVAIPIIIAFALFYFVPTTAREVALRLNDQIVQLAANMPEEDSQVSERTMVLPAATKVVSVTAAAPAVATPQAMGPQPVVKTS